MNWVGVMVVSAAASFVTNVFLVIGRRRRRAQELVKLGNELAGHLARLEEIGKQFPRVALHAMRMHRFIESLTKLKCSNDQRCIRCHARSVLEHLDDPPGPDDLGSGMRVGKGIISVAREEPS